jgi:ABC-type Mn2+/Zn2+ transport system permease subunit
VLSVLHRSDGLRLHAAWPRGRGDRRDRLRRDGRVRRPQGDRVHRRRREPRVVPGRGHRVHARAAHLSRRAVAAVGTALAIGYVSRRSRLRLDTAIGVLFAGAFALGVLLYSSIDSYTGDLLGYLLGNILGIGITDLVQVAVLGAIVLAIVIVMRKELLYATFDPLGAAAAGLPVERLEYLLLGLLGVTIIVSIQAVGIILVVAMLVTPAATAQLLVARFDRMTVVGAALATVAAVLGLYGSFYLNVASGPAIVLLETLFFVLALVLGPRTGWLARRRAAAAVAA